MVEDTLAHEAPLSRGENAGRSPGGAPRSPGAAVGEDLEERTAPQLVEADPGPGCSIVLGDSPAVDRPCEEVEQPLPGGGIVEDVTHQGGLGGLFHEVGKAGRR